jgi:hypothetical protein
MFDVNGLETKIRKGATKKILTALPKATSGSLLANAQAITRNVTDDIVPQATTLFQSDIEKAWGADKI